MDAVDKRYVKLAQRLGAADRQRLDAHLERLRDLEKRIGTISASACAPPVLVDTTGYNPTSGLNSADDGSITDLATDAAIPKVGKLMMDMIVMAFACDKTSVAYLQWSDSEAKYTLPWLGLPEHHNYYENSGGYQPAALEKIYTWYSSQHAYLLQQLASIDLGGHSMLDETVVVLRNGGGPPRHPHQEEHALSAGRRRPAHRALGSIRRRPAAQQPARLSAECLRRSQHDLRRPPLLYRRAAEPGLTHVSRLARRVARGQS